MAAITGADWALARATVRRAVATSLHCSIASTNPDGTAHVTPIGSVLLHREDHSGIYFDVFNSHLARNVTADPRVTILAVDAGRLRWLSAFARGRFRRSPGVQLTATVGAARPATPDEVHRFRRVVGPLGRLPGGRAMWGGLSTVRDLRVTAVRPIRLGSMTRARTAGPITASRGTGTAP